MTVCRPGVPASVSTVIRVGLLTVTPVCTLPPMVTVAPATKFVPVRTMRVPPAESPDGGKIVATAGDTVACSAPGSRPSTPVESITTTSCVPGTVDCIVSVIVPGGTTVQPPGSPSR